MKPETKDIRYSENSNQATLWQFKQVIATGDVRYLLIMDSYDEWPELDIEPLESVWYGIYSEFSEAVGGNRSDLWLIKEKTFLAQQFDLDLKLRALNIVKMLRIPEAEEIANLAGLEIDLYDFDRTYEKAKARVGLLQNRLRRAENERSNQPEEKQDIDALIVSLEKFQGYQFDEHKMSVRKFANIYKHYKLSLKEKQ